MSEEIRVLYSEEVLRRRAREVIVRGRRIERRRRFAWSGAAVAAVAVLVVTVGTAGLGGRPRGLDLVPAIDGPPVHEQEQGAGALRVQGERESRVLEPGAPAPPAASVSRRPAAAPQPPAPVPQPTPPVAVIDAMGGQPGEERSRAGWLVLTQRAGAVDRLHIVDLGSGDARPLTRPDTSATDPAFAPGGGAVAFIESAGHERFLTTVALNGGPAHRLTDPEDDAPTALAWSPDGARLVFASARGEESRLVVVERDGAAPRTITTATSVGQLAWSPDGRRLAFRHRGDAAGSAVDVVDVDTGARTRVTAVGTFAAEGALSWSKDGRTLAFLAARDPFSANHGIWTWTDGSGASEVPDVKAFASTGVRFSPVSDEILFRTETELRVVRPDGSGARTIVVEPPGPGGGPRWSASGGSVYFTSGSPASAIHAIRSDGTQRRVVAATRAGPQFDVWEPAATG